MKLRKIIIIALAVMLAFLPGCQRNDPDGRTILTWAIWDYDMTVYYRPLIDAYQDMNPHVRIDHVDLGSADFMTVLGTQLSGGAHLDVLSIKDIPGYANLVRQNRLEPLSDFSRTAGIDTGLYGGTVEQITVDGEFYALPFRSDFWLIFYNKDLFDEAGVPWPGNEMTLDEYEAIARSVTGGTGANRVFGAHYHTWRSAVQLFGILDGQNSIVDGNYDFLAPYYEQVLRMQNDNIVQSYSMLRTSGTHYSGVFFNNQIAMMNMGTWFIATQIDRVAAGESRAVNWGLVKYPVPAGVSPGTTLGTITALGVNRNSRNKDLALDFLKFVTGSEGAAILADYGVIPAILDDYVIDTIAATPGFPEDEGSKEALRVHRAYLEMPMHPRSADIELILNEAHDNIMTINTTVERGIQEMNDRVTRLLEN